MLVTKSWIQSNYNKFNNLYWDGKLPDISFKVGRAKKTWGYAAFNYDYRNSTIHPTYIVISNYYDSPENVKIQTLLHEMIHIADYTFHPEHFIKNGRRVSARYYDAHGTWFKKEAQRISEASGYKITAMVTKDEQNVSKLSGASSQRMDSKRENLLISAVYGNNGNVFYFVTSKNNVDIVRHTITLYNFYKLNGVKYVKFYTIKDYRYLRYRACCRSLRGWHISRMEFINKLKNMKATEYHGI